MQEDNRLKIFKAVATEGNFTRAARSLCITQSAVSQCIAELEREAGVILFERGRGTVRLTAAGETFARHADRILQDYAALGRLFGPEGRLASRSAVTVFAPSFVQEYLLPGLIADFRSVSSAPLVFVPEAEKADMVFSLVPVSGTLDFESVPLVSVSIPAVAACSAAPGEMPDLLVWAPFRPLLTPEEATRVSLETDSVAALVAALRRRPGAVAYLPIQAVEAGLTVLPQPLPHLSLELRLRMAEPFSRSRTGVFFSERLVAAAKQS